MKRLLTVCLLLISSSASLFAQEQTEAQRDLDVRVRSTAFALLRVSNKDPEALSNLISNNGEQRRTDSAYLGGTLLGVSGSALMTLTVSAAGDPIMFLSALGAGISFGGAHSIRAPKDREAAARSVILNQSAVDVFVKDGAKRFGEILSLNIAEEDALRVAIRKEVTERVDAHRAALRNGTKPDASPVNILEIAMKTKFKGANLLTGDTRAAVAMLLRAQNTEMAASTANMTDKEKMDFLKKGSEILKERAAEDVDAQKTVNTNNSFMAEMAARKQLRDSTQGEQPVHQGGSSAQ